MQRALELSMRDMSTEEVVNVQSRHPPTSNIDEEDEVRKYSLFLSAYTYSIIFYLLI